MFRKHPQFAGQVCHNLRFFEFSKKWKMASFKLKNLCDESSKIKNLRWQISWIFRCRRYGIIRFFCRCCFHGEICRSKLPVLEIFKKTQKRVFSYSKIWSLELISIAFFYTHLVGLSKRIIFHPQTFIKDTKWVNISSTWLVYKLSQLSTSLSYMCTIIAIKHIHQNFNFDIWAT